MKVIVLRHRRVSQVSLGAEGGSNALSTGNGRALQNFNDFVDTKCTGFRGGRTRGCESDEKSSIRRARKGQVGFKSGVKERRLSSGSGGVFMQVPQPNPSRVETRVGLGSGSRCWYKCSDSER